MLYNKSRLYDNFEQLIDHSIRPSRTEVERYAKFLGLDLPEDQDLLWLCEERLQIRLPREWSVRENARGERVYSNTITGETSLTHPYDDYYIKLARNIKLNRGSTHYRRATASSIGSESSLKPRELIFKTEESQPDKTAPSPSFGTSTEAKFFESQASPHKEGSSHPSEEEESKKSEKEQELKVSDLEKREERKGETPQKNERKPEMVESFHASELEAERPQEPHEEPLFKTPMQDVHYPEVDRAIDFEDLKERFIKTFSIVKPNIVSLNSKFLQVELAVEHAILENNMVVTEDILDGLFRRFDEVHLAWERGFRTDPKLEVTLEKLKIPEASEHIRKGLEELLPQMREFVKGDQRKYNKNALFELNDHLLCFVKLYEIINDPLQTHNYLFVNENDFFDQLINGENEITSTNPFLFHIPNLQDSLRKYLNRALASLDFEGLFERISQFAKETSKDHIVPEGHSVLYHHLYREKHFLKNKLSSAFHRVFPQVLETETKSPGLKDEIIKELKDIREELRKIAANEEYLMITTSELNEVTLSLLELKPGSIDVILAAEKLFDIVSDILVRISALLSKVDYYQHLCSDERASSIDQGLARMGELVFDAEPPTWSLLEIVDEMFSELKKTLSKKFESPQKSPNKDKTEYEKSPEKAAKIDQVQPHTEEKAGEITDKKGQEGDLDQHAGQYAESS